MRRKRARRMLSADHDVAGSAFRAARRLRGEKSMAKESSYEGVR